ncbi:Hypothetical predicted protein [Marmota monax]|uniref:Large ribosomal subunit protein uL15/eL18 domain-containing protein n=1 Tax=Marmota monax TaxID=9995 RepID=A0A5E4A9J6_MARMO|nr:hypothetical protein GHT09_015976 [Marmota monax]VTJ53690.1 Hypothetical predicted protein [Marmota monax]
MKHLGGETKTAVVVGTITDEDCVQAVPKLKVWALGISSQGHSLIFKAVGKILTFDQLALDSPKGRGTVLRGVRAFGEAPRTPYSHTKPYVPSKGWKFKHASDRRASPGYKNQPWILLLIQRF